MSGSKRHRLVGDFIRKQREALSLSQRALGLRFEPAVTTQFISNVERGVTPLPPAHVPTLAKALQISETEIMGLLEREYALKLSDRLGKSDLSLQSDGGGNGSNGAALSLVISPTDIDFMRNLYEAYRQADPKTRQALALACENVLKLPKGAFPTGSSAGSSGAN